MISVSRVTGDPSRAAACATAAPLAPAPPGGRAPAGSPWRRAEEGLVLAGQASSALADPSLAYDTLTGNMVLCGLSAGRATPATWDRSLADFITWPDAGRYGRKHIVLRRQPGDTWVQVQKLRASDDDMGWNCGPAYVLQRQRGGNWSELARLRPWDGHFLASSGQSVALSGNLAPLGVPQACGQDPYHWTAAPYVYRRAGDATWPTRGFRSRTGTKSALGRPGRGSADRPARPGRRLPAQTHSDPQRTALRPPVHFTGQPQVHPVA